MRGGYAGHGETYAHPEDIIWWARGGKLYGEAWKRIAFLRKLLEADAAPSASAGAPVESASTPPGASSFSNSVATYFEAQLIASSFL